MGEGKIIDINKGRKKLNFKKILSVLKIPIIVLAVATALLLSARIVGKVAMSNVTDAFRQIKTVFSKGSGFPYSLDEFEVDKVEAVGNRILVLTDNNSIVLDRKAGELYKTQLFVNDTKVITYNGRALLYSNNSEKIVMHSKTEELGSVEADGAIVTATLAKNGWFAISHSSGETLSVLTVYNSSFEKEFVWNCANERITAIALTPDGKNIAVSAMGVENADIYSRILYFNTKESKPLFDSKLKGTMVLKMLYPSDEAVIAVGDNKTLVLDEKGKIKEEYLYTETGLLFAEADEKGNVAVCFSDTGGFESKIYAFKKDGSELCTLVVKGRPDALDIGSNRIAYVFNGELIAFNFKGKEKDRFKVSGDVEKVMICSGDFYTLENKQICKYK